MTGTNGAHRLARELHDGDLAELDGISDEQAQQLLSLVEAERQRRDAALSRAINGGLSVVPRPMRGIVKKLVFAR